MKDNKNTPRQVTLEETVDIFQTLYSFCRVNGMRRFRVTRCIHGMPNYLRVASAAYAVLAKMTGERERKELGINERKLAWAGHGVNSLMSGKPINNIKILRDMAYTIQAYKEAKPFLEGE